VVSSVARKGVTGVPGPEKDERRDEALGKEKYIPPGICKVKKGKSLGKLALVNA